MHLLCNIIFYSVSYFFYVKGDVTEKSKLNESVDNLDLRVSTRGRKIMPPLNFWTGEIIFLFI